ncbi:MAG: hypothetical protein ACRCTZ_20250, partial [Sarcina sp.]
GVYVALRALYNINYTKTLVSLDQIWYTLTGKVEKIPRRQKDNLIKGLEELEEMQGIKILEEQGSNYLIDMKNLHHTYEEYGHYEEIELKVIQRLFNEGQFNILRYWLYVLGSIEEYYVVISMEDIIKDLKFAKSTLIKYNKAFMDLKVMYVNQRELKIIDENGSIKTITNSFSLWKDRDKTKEGTTKYIERLGGKVIYNTNREPKDMTDLNKMF